MCCGAYPLLKRLVEKQKCKKVLKEKKYNFTVFADYLIACTIHVLSLENKLPPSYMISFLLCSIEMESFFLV